MYYFCIDGGETKSNAILFDYNAKVLAKSKSDSGNVYNDVRKVEKNINSMWSDCCKKAKLNKEDIKAETIASFGLAGVRFKKNRDYLIKNINYFNKLILSTDGYIALAATFKNESVGVLNIGTGVVAHLMLKNKHSQQLSGWGFPYGDKGGGWWIGLRMVQETLKAIDGYINKKDIVVKETLNIIGKKDLQILNWASQSKPIKLAKLSKIFFSITSRSNIFESIVNEGVSEIELILNYIIKKAKVDRIYLVGGISKFYKPFLKKKYSKYLIFEDNNPLFGALRIAKKKFPNEFLINDKKKH